MNERERDEIRKQAEQIYEQTRQDPAYAAAGFPMTPIQQATKDEIENHLVMIAEVAEEIGTRLYAEKMPFPATREQIVEIAEKKARAYRRGAGARALSAKYGKDAAERIIYKKTGKHVNLRQ